MSEERAPAPSMAEPFEQMAKRIRLNEADTFGGAFVIVPPEGPPLTALVSGASDIGQFYVWLQGQITRAVAEADQVARQGRGFR